MESQLSLFFLSHRHLHAVRRSCLNGPDWIHVPAGFAAAVAYRMTEKLAPSERHQYIQGDRTIYEWDQTLQELNIYVQVPQGCRGKDLAVNIQAKHLSIALKGNPPYLEASTLQESHLRAFLSPSLAEHI